MNGPLGTSEEPKNSEATSPMNECFPMADIVVIFDFDRTIIDGDSDRLVVTEMGLIELFNQLRSTMPWNSLMDRIVEELHSQGKTPADIAECLKQAVLHPRIAAAIKAAHALGCDLKIISDANVFYIKTILEHHGLVGCFSDIYSNPAFADKEGRIKISPFHDFISSHHGCDLCPPNMCKGLVINQIRDLATKNGKVKKFIYLGDGFGDYCPTLKLEEGDYVMPRANYPLWQSIHSNPRLIKAKVHEWSDGLELERILLQFINKIHKEIH